MRQRSGLYKQSADHILEAHSVKHLIKEYPSTALLWIQIFVAKMARVLLICTVLIAGAFVLCSAGGFGGGGEHKKYLIHVPFHIKHHHHTHTIVKHVHHHAEKPEYKVLGYTHDEGHGHGGGGGGGGHEGLSGGYDFGGHSGGGDIGGHSGGGDIGGGEIYAGAMSGGSGGGYEEHGGHGWE